MQLTNFYIWIQQKYWIYFKYLYVSRRNLIYLKCEKKICFSTDQKILSSMKIQGSPSLMVPNLNVITTVDNNTMQRALNLSLLNNTVYTWTPHDINLWKINNKLRKAELCIQTFSSSLYKHTFLTFWTFWRKKI
jgi:hypothetical protein